MLIVFLDKLTLDFTIADEKGSPLCELSGISVDKHRSTRKASTELSYDVVAEKLPAEPISYNLADPTVRSSASTIIHYVQGEEMLIKAKLLSLNRYDKHDVWFLADNDANGAAARGLTRTLRREIPPWRIRLVLFQPTITLEHRISALPSILEKADSEDEIEVDGDGVLFAPRITLYTPPIAGEDSYGHQQLRFDSAKSYILLGGVGSLGVRVALWMYEVCCVGLPSLDECSLTLYSARCSSYHLDFEEWVAI